MELTRHQDVRSFVARAEPFLVAHEAVHNLFLGLTAEWLADPASMPQVPYLATVDAAGEIVAAALYAPPHNLVLSLAPAAALPAIAADVQRVYPTLPGVLGPADVSRAFAEVWQGVSGRSFRRGRLQRVYQLQQVRPVSGVSGELRRATSPERDLIVEWVRAFGQETRTSNDPGEAEHAADVLLHSSSRGLYLWHDGQPVSMAGYAGPTPHGIRINYVYTPPSLRRRGYASALVAALSQHLLDAGRRYCFLFTDLTDPTSNRVYQSIGYEAMMDIDEYVFEQLPTSG